ncbi:hypothetical protein [Carboxydothermus ferrireducens]|uniref:Uncharacterized protein n=1 Tax=Carboxydothermus ferrireducens DSM 11255 TaxID=1119529 RepID=A0ABX2R7H9_9THEO|nr:hypothetical protein [Carboxydothermus ferrireducens]NYE57126.1 hypothetical protein [Carboxydothermus ferrireducens DSM 11255]
MKVLRKPIPMEAVKYEKGKGLEDGFICGIDPRDDCDDCRCNENYTCKYKTPYVLINGEKVQVYPGVFIITGVSGEKYIVDEEIFRNMYDVILEETF